MTRTSSRRQHAAGLRAARRLLASGLVVAAALAMPLATSAGAAQAAQRGGTLLAWGLNASGQLGNGTTTISDVPVPVVLPAATTVTALSAGAFHSLALTVDSRALAWGSDEAGQLGDGTTDTPRATPVQVALPAGVTVASISAGAEHSLAVALALPK